MNLRPPSPVRGASELKVSVTTAPSSSTSGLTASGRGSIGSAPGIASSRGSAPGIASSLAGCGISRLLLLAAPGRPVGAGTTASLTRDGGGQSGVDG